ncbi:MAG: hypothetical protein ACK5MK_00905, partial [Dysgonomonas sp.]
MKKSTLLIFLLCMLVSLTAWSSGKDHRLLLKNKKANSHIIYIPKQGVKKTATNKFKLKKVSSTLIKKKSPKRLFKSVNADAQVVLTEDFSKFTSGSEATPDATDLADADNNYFIADQYTSTPGWDGFGVFQAGGVCYLGMADYDNGDGTTTQETGYIDTPVLSLAANSTIKFRARSASASGDTFAVLWVDADGYYDGADIQLTSTWQDFTVECPDGTDATYFQMYSYESPCYIDDIEVNQVKTGINAPEATYPTNVTTNGFTANWTSVADATSYLLSVYSYSEETSPIEETTVTEGFDGINIAANSSNKKIDLNNPNYPQGWTIDVSTNGTSRHIYTSTGNYQSAPLSLAFDYTGDYIITPLTPAPISSLSMWLKANGGYSSAINVKTFDGTSWTLAGTIELDSEDATTVDISDILPAGTVQVRFDFVKDAGNFAIDDISYTYGGSIQSKNYLLKDHTTTDTSYDVSNTLADVQYYYTVKATDDEFVSKESNEMLVKEYQTSLEAPIMLPATNITNKSFTANWQAVDGANYYAFYTYLTHTAAVAEKYVIASEDFSKSLEGTFDDPIGDDFELYLDEYTNRPDWYAFLPLLAEGMIGFDNSLSEYGLPGYLQLPSYEFTPNGGKLTLELTVVGAVGDEITATNAYASGDYESLSAVLTSATQNLVFEFTNPTETTGSSTIYIESSGAKAFISDAKLSKDLAAGESVSQPYYYTELENTSTDVTINDKTAGDTYAYTAMAIYIPDNEDEDVLFSDFGSLMQVTLLSGIEGNTLSSDKIFVADNNLHVVLEKAGSVYVYNVSGILYKKIEAQ